MAAIPQNVYDMCNKATLLADMPPPPNWKGNLINRPRTAVEVEVTKVEPQKDHGHHVYDVEIVLNDVLPSKPINWTLAKTFSDFRHLHNKVKPLIDNNTIHFPPDPLLHHHDPVFMQERKALLQTYLQALYLSLGPFGNTDLNEFLLYDANVDEAIAEAIDIGQAHYIAQMQAQGKGLLCPPIGYSQPSTSAAPVYSPSPYGGYPQNQLSQGPFAPLNNQPQALIQL